MNLIILFCLLFTIILKYGDSAAFNTATGKVLCEKFRSNLILNHLSTQFVREKRIFTHLKHKGTQLSESF